MSYMITTVKYKAILKAASQHAIPKCLEDLTEWGGKLSKRKNRYIRYLM